MVVIRSLLPIVAQQLLRSRDFILLSSEEIAKIKLKVLLSRFKLATDSEKFRTPIFKILPFWFHTFINPTFYKSK